MLPTEILKSEHRVIEQVLEVLQHIAEGAAKDKLIDAASATQALDFFRNFADRCHHGKEEAQLFPMMESKGFDRDSGPTGVMCDEHEEGRALIKGMADSIEANNPDGFAEYANEYVRMLRMHIQKEDHCLFSMADKVFSTSDQDELLRLFEEVEVEHMGAGTHEKYLQIANDLADRYGVAKVSEGTGCTCSHQH
ncbi:MAG: hemerythrin domain-containing protein [FCB group bacterium]|jgi:hemerythrin-like domain-containing protein|nr:hemerythrin domain-containing protein [FCB group bacterium]